MSGASTTDPTMMTFERPMESLCAIRRLNSNAVRGRRRSECAELPIDGGGFRRMLTPDDLVEDVPQVVFGHRPGLGKLFLGVDLQRAPIGVDRLRQQTIARLVLATASLILEHRAEVVLG